MEYKTTISKQLKMLGYAIYFIAFILIGVYFLRTSQDIELEDKYAYIVCIVIASSTLYIHVTYYLEDRGKVLQISDDQISLTQNGQTVSYPFDALESMTVVGSKNIEDFGIRQFPAEGYFYAKLLFADGKQIYITSLMITDYNKMVDAFQNRYVAREYGLYNLLPGT